MKMEIQRKLWTSRYEKGALTVAFVHKCALTACADPGVFVMGVQARQPENSLDNVFFCFFFVLKLLYSLVNVYSTINISFKVESPVLIKLAHQYGIT